MATNATRTADRHRAVPADTPRPDHILLVHRFFHPDVTTYAQMLRHLADHLTAEGHAVTVYSTQPSYNAVGKRAKLPRVAVENGVTVHRARIPGGGSSAGRLLGGMLFALRLVLHVAANRRRYSAISVSTVPPVVMGIAGRVGARLSSARFVYHCMDLYPEIAVASGFVSDRGLRTRLAARLDSSTVRAADRVVVLSEDMRDTLRRRGLDVANVLVRNNFSIADSDHRPGDEPRSRAGGPLQLLFAGNVGRFQGLEELIRGLALFLEHRPGGAELTIMGAGVQVERLRGIADDLGLEAVVRFEGHRPEDDARRAMAEADLCVVSLTRGIVGAAYPSKTITYLESGSRLLAIVEPASALARMVRSLDLGVVAEPGDPASIAAALETEAADSTPRSSDRAHAAARDAFGRDGALAVWSEIYADLGRAGRP